MNIIKNKCSKYQKKIIETLELLKHTNQKEQHNVYTREITIHTVLRAPLRLQEKPTGVRSW